MNFINGELVQGSGEAFTRTSPVTGKVLHTLDLATPHDVDAAVIAAQTALHEWRQTTPAERSAILLRWASELESIADDLAKTESDETGKALKLAQEFDIPGTIDNASFFAGAARQLAGLAAGTYWPGSTSMIRREPIGVIGSIAPWNYPLQMAAWKVLPAIAAGNTIVLKPSELTPSTTLKFAEAAVKAGLPHGVFNVVVGTGKEAGEALVKHPAVAMTSFTGSTAVGRRIMAMAAEKGSRVHLELGGKAPFVVFGDADVEAAARGAVAGSLINGGQDCTAATRAIVHESVFDTFVKRVATLMSGVRVGNPSDSSTDLGSLITPEHRDRVRGFVKRAFDQGAVAACGGNIPPQFSEANTAFFEPTLLTGVTPEHEIWREEVFGPVLVAVPFSTQDEAIRLANDTRYGLAASVWTNDTNTAFAASARIEAGCVWVNEHIPIVSEMPHGGYKASGFGKDMSQYAFEEYTQIKHVLVDHSPAVKEWHSIIFTDPAGAA